MPSWRDLKRFCENDGWELTKSTDHDYYQKMNSDGTMRSTRVSRGSGQINGNLWNRILRRQLAVTKEYFNSKI